MRTRDFEEWENVTDKLSYPKGMRHGTVLAVSQDVVNGLTRNQIEANAGGAGKVEKDKSKRVTP